MPGSRRNIGSDGVSEQDGKRGRKSRKGNGETKKKRSAVHLGAAFLRLLLSPADASSFDQRSEVVKGRAQAHEWVLQGRLVAGFRKWEY